MGDFVAVSRADCSALKGAGIELAAGGFGASQKDGAIQNARAAYGVVGVGGARGFAGPGAASAPAARGTRTRPSRPYCPPPASRGTSRRAARLTPTGVFVTQFATIFAVLPGCSLHVEARTPAPTRCASAAAGSARAVAHKASAAEKGEAAHRHFLAEFGALRQQPAALVVGERAEGAPGRARCRCAPGWTDGRRRRRRRAARPRGAARRRRPSGALRRRSAAVARRARSQSFALWNGFGAQVARRDRPSGLARRGSRPRDCRPATPWVPTVQRSAPRTAAR